MRKGFLLVVISIILASLTLWGSRVLFKKEKKTKPQALRIALPSDVSTLHFASGSKGCSINSSHVMTLLFDGLTRRDENDLPELAIADSITISEDQKTYTFHLRDCRWSDGEEVTAYDFEFAWKKVLCPESKEITQAPFFYYPIKNAEKRLQGKVKCKDLGIHVIDNKTLQVDLEYPAPYFLHLVASPYFFPAPKHVAKEDPDWATQGDLVCNGPFKLVKREHQSEISLSKNPSHWDSDHVYLEEIKIYVVQNSSTALGMFEKGDLDWIGSPFVRISFDISYKTLGHHAEDCLVYWLAVNTEKFPLNNEKLRRALSLAIDRESITENVFYKLAEPLMSVLPHSMSLKKEPYFEDHNSLSAKKLFEEALDELGISLEELPEIELGYVADLEIHHRTTQAIQDQWRKVLGIKNIYLHPVEYNVYFDNVTKGDYEIGFMGWASHVLDPLFILNSFKEQSDPMNKTRWENDEFKSLLNKSNFVLSHLERSNLLIQAETLLMEEMPVVPICSLKKWFAKNPKLKGEKLSRLQCVDFKSAYFEEDLN